MKLKIAAILTATAPLAFAFSPAAQAQDASAATTQKPIALQIGAGYIPSGDGRSASSDFGLHVGGRYILPLPALSASVGGHSSIDADYNHNAGNGGHVDSYGLTYMERIPFSKTTGPVVPYGGIGIGIFRADAKVRRTKTTTTTTLGGAVRRPLQINSTGGSNGGLPPPTPTGSNGGTTTTTTSSYFQSGNSTNIGGKILLGLQFQGGVYTEVSYILSGSTQGVRSDTVNVDLGIRF